MVADSWSGYLLRLRVWEQKRVQILLLIRLHVSKIEVYESLALPLVKLCIVQ